MAKFQVGDVIESNGHQRIITAVGEMFYLLKQESIPYEQCETINWVDVNYKLKPKEATITREVLEAAWNKTQNVSGMKVPDHYMNALCEELGL